MNALEFSIKGLRDFDWASVEQEVVQKLRALHGLMNVMADTPKTRDLIETGIKPAILNLAQFCTRVELKGETIHIMATPKDKKKGN